MKSLLKISILIFVILALSTCDIFFLSSFPSSLPYVELMVDIRDYIGSNKDWHDSDNQVKLHILNDYVFMTSGRQDLYIFDKDLKLQKKDVGNVNSSYDKFAVYVTSSNTYYIGNQVIGPTFSVLGTTNGANDPNNPGFHEPAGDNMYQSKINTGSSTFFLDRIVGPTPLASGLGAYQSASASSDKYVQNAVYDNQQQRAYMFIGDSNDGGDGQTSDVLIFDLTALNAGGANLSGSYPNFVASSGFVGVQELYNCVEDHAYYTRDGFITHDRGTARLYDINTSGTKEKIPMNIEEYVSFAYRIEGDYYYYADPDTGYLYKCRSWWN